MTNAARIKIDDDALLRRYKAGDTDAIAQLVIKYQNRIYNAISRICANPADAAELTQDTFVKVIESIDKFQGRSSFYTWAFRIAVNLALNHAKRNVRIGHRSIDAGSDRRTEKAELALKDFLSDDSSPDPAAVAQNKELQEIAVNSLNQLDDDQRAVVVLRDIEAMSYAQIAEVLGIEIGTVRSRLSRARSNLRDILEAFLR